MSKSYTSVFIKYAMCAFGLSLFFVALTVFAQANPQINYQGKLTDSTGVAVANGSYDMEFRLYTAASGGSAIWTETLVGANQVPVVNGLFSVMLGSTTAFTSVDFDQTLYLGVNIDSDGEMTPRKILGTVPAAFVAQTANDSVLLDGIASSSFLRSDQADVMTATESSTLLTINQSGTGDILSLLDSGTKVFTVTDGGNVGIGTSSPASMLHVAGASPDLTLQNTALGGEKWTFEANTPGLRLQRDGAGVVLFEDDGNTNFFRPDGLSSSLYIRQNGNIGLSTTSPLYTLTVDGDALFAAGIYDNNYTRGTNGQVLQTTGSGLEWVATSTLGIGGASTFLSLTDSQSSFTANRITFTNSGATALTDSADLTFDGDILSVGGQLNLATTSHVLITQNGTPILHNDSGAGNFGLTDNVFSFNTTGYDLTAFGSGSLANNTTGFDNTAVGFIALSGNEEGSNNTAIGSSVFYLSTSSSGNTGLGAYAGENLTTGSSNLFLGYRVGDSLTTGSNNILIGYDVEAPNNTGSNQLNIGDAIFGNLSTGNIGIGTTTPFTKLTVAGDAMFTGGLYDNAYSAGTNGQLLSSTGAGIDWVDANAALSGVLAINDLSDGLYNGTSDSLALGEDAGNAFNAAGLGNIAIGYQAGFESGSTTDSDRITLIGYQAGYENTGADNTAMGYNSLFSNKGDNATAIGVNAAVSNTGGSLTAMGVNAGEGNRGNGLTAMGVNSAFNNTGTALTAVGVNSAYKNVGTGVSAFGHSTLRYISTSTAATVFGYQAGQGDLGGAEVANLTAFGYRAGRSLQTGADNNLFIGFEAGKNVTTGSDNILIGYSAETSSPIASEELNIGNVLFSDLSTGFVGIGTSSPAAGLHIQTQNSPTGRDPSNSADDFLIDQTGNAGMTILSGNSAVGSIYFGDIENSSRGRLAYNHSDDDFSLWTNSIERLTIDSSGNIGIGTTTPFTKLTVDGNAMLTGSLYDNAYSAGTVGQLFSSNGSGVEWTDASSALSETLSVDDLTDGIYNVTSDSLALGVSAGNSFNGTGLDNVALGYFAGYESGSTTVSDQITVVGSEAGYQNLGDSLSAFGTVSAYQNTGSSVSAFGRNSAYQNKGDFVSAFGQNSAFENTGSSVSAFGRNSAYQNTSNFVSAFGYNTLRNISTSTAATVFGYQTGRGAVVGAEVANLTAFGYQSGLSLETGADNNIFIGHQAGRNHKTGSDNVLIGYSVEATSPTASHQLNIADAIFGDLITGNIGIGTTTPAQKLQVYGDIRVGNSGTNGCIEDFAGGNIGGTCTSDERLKTNIDPLSSDGRSYIERLVALDPVTYQWNELAADTYKKSQASVVTGLIAQDVEEQFPELVSRNNDGYRQVDFRSLPFYILEALREMWEVVTGNTERVDLLEKENKDLRSRLEAIESQLGTSVSAPTVIGEDPEPVIESEEEGLGVIAEEVDSEPATISASNTDTQAEEDPVVVNMPEEIEGEATTTASVLPETLIEEALSPAESSDEEVVIDENVPEENLVESESEIPVETDEIVEEETV